MIEDTRPLGKSIEEIGRDSGNLDSERNAGGEEKVQGGGMIPPVSLSGSSGTAATATVMGVLVMPTADRTGGTDGDGNNRLPMEPCSLEPAARLTHLFS